MYLRRLEQLRSDERMGKYSFSMAKGTSEIEQVQAYIRAIENEIEAEEDNVRCMIQPSNATGATGPSDEE